jgi:hypothetical protein
LTQRRERVIKTGIIAAIAQGLMPFSLSVKIAANCDVVNLPYAKLQ